MQGSGAGVVRWLAVVVCLGLLSALAPAGLTAQERPPTEREVTVTFTGWDLSPARIEVGQGDVVRLRITTDQEAHSFTLDEYRISRRIQPGEPTTIVFRADRAGSFVYYCTLTSDDRHGEARGTLVVTAAP